MSTTIDEKVVEMRFDNKQFENNVQTSLSTLDKLKNSLKLDGASKSFENIDKAAKNVSFEGIAAGIEALQARFSTFGIVGMRIIENITDSMMGLANKTIGFLTNGIVQGGINRAMNLEDAHFQLQGLLKDEEAVSAVMKNVNDSVDGTAYSLDSAAKVASQLAASGMRAGDQMFTSLRAVAGVAAMTNSEYDEIGKIFTTVAGNGRLMGEQLLQLSSRGMNAAATLADYLHTTEADVREMVSDGEISFEIFAAAMDDAFGEHAKKANETFTGAMSNIKAALARIGAEFISPLVVQNGSLVKLFNTLRERINDVKANIGPLADTFVSTVTTIADTATEYLAKLDLTNHFKIFYNVVDTLKNVLKGTWSIIKPIGQAFLDIFPPKTTDQIVGFTEALKNLTSRFELSNTASSNLKSTFRGLFAVLDIIKEALLAVFKTTSPLLGGLKKLGGRLLNLTGSWGEWLVELDKIVKKSDIFKKAIRGIIDFVKKAADAVRDFANKVKEKFNLPDFDTVKESVKDFVKTVTENFKLPGFEALHSLLDRIHNRVSQVKDAAGSLKDGFIKAIGKIGDALSEYKFIELLQALWSGSKAIAGGIGEVIGTLLGTIAEKLDNSDFNGLLDIINSVSLSAIAFGIAEVLETIAKPMRPFSGVISNVKIALQELRVTLAEYQAQLKAKTLMTIATAIAILAASIIALSFIDSDKLNVCVGAITMLFAELVGSMAAFTRVSKSSAKVIKTSAAMIAMSVSLSILAGVMKKLAALEWEEIAKGLVGIAGLAVVVVASAKIMSSGSGHLVKGATSLVTFAIAIKILASVCKDLSVLNWSELAVGLAGVGGLLAEITIFLNHTKFGNEAISTATSIVILAAAMKILASACKDFGEMSWEEIGKGLASVGVLLTEIALFTKITGNAKHVMSTGTSLVIIAASMKIFASAMSDFGAMSWEKIGKGLTVMGGTLAEVAIATRLMPKNMVGIGAGLVIVGASLEIVADVLSKLGDFSWEQIGKGLITLGVALAELAVGLKLMNGTLAGSAAMLVAAAALAVLTPVLGALGSMRWETIVKGLVSIAGAFAVLGIAGAVLTPIVPAILGLGIAVLAVGAGLLALSAGFTALATVGTAGATVIAASLAIIVTGIAELIPVVIAKIGEGIIAFCQAIADGAPVFKDAVLGLLDVLVECIPEIAEGALKLVTEILAALAEYTPKIVDSLLKILIGLLESIADNLPTLIKAAVDVLMAFFSGIADALSGIDTEVLLKGIIGVGLLSAIIFALSMVSSFVPGAMIGVLGIGAIIAELALVLAAIGGLAQIPGLSWLIDEGGKLLEEIGTAIGSFVGGIVGGFMSGVSSQFPKIGSDLSSFMTNLKPFIEGASKIKASAMDGVKALGEAILILTAADILQGLTSWLTGGSSITDFGAELAAFGPYFNKYYQSVKGVDGSVVESSANAAKTLAEMADNLPNSGGVAGWFAGENSLAAFAEELVEFGPKLKKYAESVKGLDADVIINSANAAKALAEMASNLPNSGGVAGWFMGENDLSSFAEELAEFGPVLKEYADSVTGLNANVVVNSANAAKALAEMVDNLPNQGGAASWFIGDNTLSVFAEELAEFGPKLKGYAESVEGLKADVVINSANAAKALSEFAANLPENGGVVSWFTGDNTLSAFGEELVTFGPSLKKYAESVNGLKSDVVINSANAAKALAELANNLPDNGGLVSWFTGDNDIGSFGESLVLFGENFARYSDYMKNVDTGIVTATTNAANSIVELQNSLPNKGGWFSDDATLADFGDDMASFGSYFSKYYNRISNVDATQLSSVITQTNSLVAMAKGMSGLDTSGMDNFGKALADLGQAGVDKFVGSFNNSASRVANAAANMLANFINEINSKRENFQTSGSALIIKLIAGVKTKENNAIKTVTNVLSNCLKAIEKKYTEFHSHGHDCMTKLIDGVTIKSIDLNDSFKSILNKLVVTVGDYREDFYSAGSYLIEGFVNGIRARSSDGIEAIRELGFNILDTFENVLDIHSPSKKFTNYGINTDKGYIVGVNKYADKVKRVMRGLGSSVSSTFQNAISKLSDVIDSDIDYEPTIRPVIDLSDVESGARLLNDMIGERSALDISSSGKLAYSVADGVNANLQYKQAYDDTLLSALEKMSLGKDKNVTYNFNQTNNSPKSLSRYEIYRQSKNLLATIKGV